MRSAWGALASAARFNSARTAAVSPRPAASATGEGSAAFTTQMDGMRIQRSTATRVVVRMVLPLNGLPTRRLIAQIEGSRAVGETVHFEPEHLQRPEHRVCHRRAVGRLDVQGAGPPGARVSDQQQRAAL